MRRQTLVILVAFLVTGLLTTVEARDWMKREIVLEDEGAPAGQYTLISTVDELEPTLMRYLFADAEGRLLVVRYEVDSSTEAVNLSFECPSSGESMVFDMAEGTPVELSSGTNLVIFEDEDRNTALVRSQAQALLNTVSLGCRTALENFTQAGIQHGVWLRAAASSLHDVFYPFYTKASSPDSGEMIVGETMNFDPNTMPPSTFEEQFGAAYYN